MIRKKKRKKSVVNSILYVISAIIIVCTFTYAINIKNSHGILGYTARIVVSGSMEPTIKINTINIIKSCGADDIEVGDIICYKYDKDIIHRVIDIKEGDDGELVINTKGDANNLPDGIEITDDMVIGKVVHTLNWSRLLVSRFSIEPGKIDGVEIMKTVAKYMIMFAIGLYIAKRLIILISLIIKAFIKKENYIDGINELDARLFELSVTTNKDIEFHKLEVKNNSKTRLHYIVNKILKARSDLLVKRLIDDIDDFNNDLNTILKIDRIVKKLDGEVIEENGTIRSTSEKIQKTEKKASNDTEEVHKESEVQLHDIMERLEEINSKIDTLNTDNEKSEEKPVE